MLRKALQQQCDKAGQEADDRQEVGRGKVVLRMSSTLPSHFLQQGSSPKVLQPSNATPPVMG